MIFVILILIILALIIGVVFLAYKFGDAVLEMFTQLIGMPKEMIILLLFGLVLAAISITLIQNIKRQD